MSTSDRTAGATGPEHIGRAVARLEAALARREGFGRRTDTSTTVLTGGLRCTSAEGGHRIDTDLPAGLGGEATGPTPSMLLRAALGSCLAMGYQLRAARHGIALDAVEVVVETDSDVAGLIGPDGRAPAGFGAIRCHVRIESSAPRRLVEAVVADADRRSPVVDALHRANELHRSLTVVGGAA